MGTIVVYTKRRPPLNAYPRRIVSPPRSSPCCGDHMEEVGNLRRENGRRFFYKRCRVCGFAVRHFLPCPVEEVTRLQTMKKKLRPEACA